jgi:hypothetical protein
MRFDDLNSYNKKKIVLFFHSIIVFELLPTLFEEQNKQTNKQTNEIVRQV